MTQRLMCDIFVVCFCFFLSFGFFLDLQCLASGLPEIEAAAAAEAEAEAEEEDMRSVRGRRQDSGTISAACMWLA